MAKPTILLIGGMGSIGQSLCEIFLKNYSFIILDKKKLKKNPKNYIQCKLDDAKCLQNIMSDIPTDLTVIYLAGNLSNSFSIDDTSKSIQDNLMGLSNFISLFHTKIKNFIYISSISVYGVPNYIPIDENHETTPFSFYGTMKKCGEVLSTTLCNNYKIPLSIIRSTQVYGIDSSSESLPHLLVSNLKNKTDLTINGDPKIKRDYIHILDFCNFIQKLILKPKAGIFNLGTGLGISVLDLFETSYKLSNKEFKMNKNTDFDHSSSFSQIMDISKIKQEFNFQPTQNIHDWLKNELLN